MPEDENLEDLSRDELEEKIKNRVVFFEPQREIILSHPDSETLNEISSLGHMETSSGEHYKFEVKEMDVWNSDKSLEEMKEVYTRVIGSYPRFMEWLERTYNKQEMFSIEHRGRYHSLVSEDPDRMD